ncbi:MAG: hypothetical protein LC745_04100 [Planctomycetia bacterium]|nr:hypothetical protein [Planctomycetia bacterium]
MAMTLVVALALAPIPFTLRTPNKEYVVATGAYEVIFLPVLTSLIVLAVMKPGRERTWAVAVLCLTPVILVVTLYVGLYAWTILLLVRRPGVLVRAVTENPFVWIAGAVAFVRLLRGQWWWRCPECGSRGLRPLSRPAPALKMWLPSGVFQCGRCGGCSRPTGSGFWPRLIMEETEPPPEG